MSFPGNLGEAGTILSKECFKLLVTVINVRELAEELVGAATTLVNRMFFAEMNGLQCQCEIASMVC